MSGVLALFYFKSEVVRACRSLDTLSISPARYGSSMPFWLYDPDGKILHDLKAANISAIVLLSEIEECGEKTGRDLLSLYRDQGLTVFPLPIPNYGVPSDGQLADVLKYMIARARRTSNTDSICNYSGMNSYNDSLLTKGGTWLIG